MAQRIIDHKVKKLAERYIAHLRAARFPVERAFVFGSRVRGDAREDSDIDVAIISPQVTDPIDSNAYLLCKSHELERNEDGIYIEPHGFNPDDFVDENPLAWEIKQTGVPIG